MKISHQSDHRPLRAAEYPPIEDQLDALWHAMDQGKLPMVEGFYNEVKRVKDKYPKPEKPS